VTPDAETIFTCDEYGVCRMWKVKTQEMVKDFSKEHDGGVRKCYMHPNGHYLFTTGVERGDMKQWRIDNKTLVKDYGDIHPDWIMCVTFSLDGVFIMTCGAKGCIKQFDVENMKQVHDYGKVHQGFISACAMKAPKFKEETDHRLPI
jgi:WD40 repeat protein